MTHLLISQRVEAYQIFKMAKTIYSIYHVGYVGLVYHVTIKTGLLIFGKAWFDICNE